MTSIDLVAIGRLLNARMNSIIAVLCGASVLLIIADSLVGFQGTQFAWSDLWHHRAVLLELSRAPFSPSNPHIVSEAGSRSFIPTYVLFGALSAWFSVSIDSVMLALSMVNIALTFVGCWMLSRAFGVRGAVGLFFVLLFAWMYPPNFTGFHNLRSLVHTVTFPAHHAFAFTLIVWSLYVGCVRSDRFPASRVVLIAALLSVVMLSHQLTALLCLGGLAVFSLLAPALSIRTVFATASVVALAVAASLSWPYFDLGIVMSSGTDHAWSGLDWFYDPVSVLIISLPAWTAILLYHEHRHDRLVNVLMFAFVSVFLAYLVTHFVGIGAGHRLLPYWILFLHLAIFVILWRKDREGSHRSLTQIIRPFFVAMLVMFSVPHILISGLDMFKLRIHQAGYAGFFGDPAPFREIGETVAGDLPEGSIVVGHENATYPIQAFGVRVVSIPRAVPMVRDLSVRQAATRQFFATDATCPQRIAAVAPYGASHAAFISDSLDDRTASSIKRLGTSKEYEGSMVVVSLSNTCIDG